MNNPLVTVAIPFYNAEKFLDQAILSVCNQTYSNIEILLLDDGSTDNSLSIAQSFALKDNRIRVHSDGKNKGLIFRLNQSVSMCESEYYARMDADDIMHPLRIEKQIEHLNNNSSIDILGTSFYSIDSENNIRGCVEIPYVHDYNHLFILHPSVIGKTEWFKNNPYDPSFERIEDKELWLRSVGKYQLRSLPIPLMYYREFGVPTLKKYLKTQINGFKIYTSYKKYNIPLMTVLKAVFLRVIKSLICILCYVFSKMDFYVSLRRRNNIPFDNNAAVKDMYQALSPR